MPEGRIKALFQKALVQRLLNLALLIGGFGLGQGSIFLSQTVLVATHEVSLLARFGTHFSFAMLGIIWVEAGSLTVLARQANQIIREGGDQKAVWQAYWETTIFRLSMAAIVVLAGLIYALSGWADAFSRAYVLASLPAFLLWAFNAAGFLDGLQKSGVAGITGAIAYIASALALYAARGQDDSTAGLMLGGALTLGYALTVIAQQASLALAGWRMHWVRPGAAGIRTAFREELAMLSGLLPGQFYFRIQLLLASVFLGDNATALLVYAKQIVGASSQMTGFIRRVEFPAVLQRLAEQPAASIRSLMMMQKTGIAFAAMLTIGLLIAAQIIAATSGGFTREAFLLLSVFGLTIFSESIGQSLIQILFAHGHYGPGAVIRILAVSMGVGFGVMFISLVGLPVFVLSDFASHATVIGLSLIYLRRKARQP